MQNKKTVGAHLRVNFSGGFLNKIPAGLFIFLDFFFFFSVGDTQDNFLLCKTFPATFPLPDPKAQWTSEQFRGSHLESRVEGKSSFCCEKWGRVINFLVFQMWMWTSEENQGNPLDLKRETFEVFSWLALGLRWGTWAGRRQRFWEDAGGTI